MPWAQNFWGGSDVITIEGVDSLHSGHHALSRTGRGAHTIAAAMTGGHLRLTQMRPHHLESLFEAMGQAGFQSILVKI